MIVRSSARSVAVLIVAAALSACSYFNASPTDEGTKATVVRVPFSGNFTYEVDTGDTPRDVFFVFSAATGTSSVTSSVRNLVVDGDTLPVPSAPKLPTSFAADYGVNATGLQRISDFNAKSRTFFTRGSRSVTPALSSTAASRTNTDYTVGMTTTFNSDGYIPYPYKATCAFVTDLTNVAIDSTPRRLIVWVDQSDYDSSGIGYSDAGKITKKMAEALGDQFLNAGSTDDDIYDWLTSILGAEWGSDASDTYNNLISFSGDIHILLTDIEGTKDPYKGIIGYFYSVNNFTKKELQDAGSAYANVTNEKIMFVIDSYMFANPDNDSNKDNGTSTWSPTGYWPEECYSTLAHEFQHMIHFYQKGVVAGATDVAEVWIDEFCAQLAEDLLATKMQVQGPRGVSYTDGSSGSAGNTEGRIPLYNGQTYMPLTVTENFDLVDYSTVYAFASWAARNYGGSEFLRRVVQSSSTGKGAVEAAAAAGGASPSDLNSLLGRWAVAVMGSDRADMPAGYRTNIGDWFVSSTGGKQYKLGSMDYFKYLPRNINTGVSGTVGGPVFIEAGQTSFIQNASSNVFYAAARNLRGSRTFSVKLPENVTMYLVTR